jgi:hypothetical protein
MATILEELVNDLNRVVFYREFSFGRNQFLKEPGVTREFADHVVWIGDLVIVFQLKEREVFAESSAEAEKKWFERKVLGKATKQIRDSLDYLCNVPNIPVMNQRGHTFELRSQTANRIVKIVLYKPTDLLPEESRRVRHHLSSTAGFIHVMAWEDYQGVCGILLTPAELEEYFQFRELLIGRADNHLALPSEAALLGQFLSGHLDHPPSEDFRFYLQRLRHDPSQFEPGLLLRNLGEKIERSEGPEGDRGYYRILTEFAKLRRNELKQANIRFSAPLEAVQKGEVYEPTRFLSVDNDCGFIFIAVPPEMVGHRLNGLKNFTTLSKYVTRLTRHVGISFAKEGSDYLIDWMLADYPWEYERELEEALRLGDPFRPMKTVEFPRYEFRT